MALARPRLQVVIASTRPGRKGASIARWFADVAITHAGFEIEVVDLAEVGLPLFDEAHHPRLRRYEHEHTKAWSAVVSRADAFVFVVPEYNHGFNAAIKNALDFLHDEWAGKPVAFVSYGGVAAGTRAVQMLKPVVGALGMVVVPTAINIPFFTASMDGDRFDPPEVVVESAEPLLTALARQVEVAAAFQS